MSTTTTCLLLGLQQGHSTGVGNYLMQLWSPLQVAAPLSQVPNLQWRWLWQAWPCHLSWSGHPPQLGSKQTLQTTVTWRWCVVQNSGNQHSIGCQIPVTSYKWQPLEGPHDRQLADHVENLLKRFYFSLLWLKVWVSKGHCWWGLRKRKSYNHVFSFLFPVTRDQSQQLGAPLVILC